MEAPVPSRDKASLIQWWCEREKAFPRPGAFVLEFLDIPEMAADCETALSLARLAVAP